MEAVPWSDCRFGLKSSLQAEALNQFHSGIADQLSIYRTVISEGRRREHSMAAVLMWKHLPANQRVPIKSPAIAFETWSQPSKSEVEIAKRIVAQAGLDLSCDITPYAGSRCQKWPPTLPSQPLVLPTAQSLLYNNYSPRQAWSNKSITA